MPVDALGSLLGEGSWTSAPTCQTCHARTIQNTCGTGNPRSSVTSRAGAHPRNPEPGPQMHKGSRQVGTYADTGRRVTPPHPTKGLNERLRYAKATAHICALVASPSGPSAPIRRNAAMMSALRLLGKRVFCDIERLSENKKINAGLNPAVDNAAHVHALRGGTRGLAVPAVQQELNDKRRRRMAMLVLLSTARLIVMLTRLHAGHLTYRIGRRACDLALHRLEARAICIRG